jgi:hypothetical protein
MKLNLRQLAWISLSLLVFSLPMGCGSDDGSDLNYRGEWRGSTSHGGTIEFSSSGNAVTSLQIVDPQADVWITQPVAIVDGTFSVRNSEGVSSPTSPAVSVLGVFNSEIQASGTYTISRGGQTVSGAFTASKQ